MRLRNPRCGLFALTASVFAFAVARAEASPKLDIPSACKLELRIVKRGDREVGVLAAEFQFRSAVADAKIALGLEQGKRTDTTTDARLHANARTGETRTVVVH